MDIIPTQMLTSAVLVQTTVQQRQHVQTLMVATLAPVTLVMMEMVSLAMVGHTDKVVTSICSLSEDTLCPSHALLLIL